MNNITFLLGAFAGLLPMYKDVANVFVILFVLFSLFVIKKNSKQTEWNKLKSEPTTKPVLLFYFVLLCLLPFSANLRESLKEFYHYLGSVFPLFLLVMLKPLKNKYSIKTQIVKNAFFAGAFFASVYTIIQFALTHNLGVSGFFGNRAFLGFVLEIAIPLVASSIFQATGCSQKIAYSALFFCYLTALLISQARGAWLGALGGLFIIIWLNRKNFNKKKILIALSLIVLFLSVMAPLYVERVKTMGDITFNTNATRLDIWKYSWKVIVNNPVAGVGLGGFQKAFVEYVEPTSTIYNIPQDRYAPHAHNSYLTIWAVSGSVGFLFFLWMIGRMLYILKERYQYQPYETSAIIGVMLAILITSFVDDAFFAAYSNKLFWLLYGLYLYDY